MSREQKATQGNRKNPVIESPRLEGPVKPAAKPAPIIPIEPSDLVVRAVEYRAQTMAMIDTIKSMPGTGRDLILAAIDGVKVGKELLADCTPHAKDGKSPEEKLGMKAIKSRVAVDRNRLAQAVQAKAGSPDKLTESVIVRQKSVSLNTFRTYR